MSSDYDLMEYQARQKSLVVSYILWLFLGMFGGHRFYAKRVGSAVAQLICTVTFIGSIVTVVWIIVDAFLIPGWIRDHNLQLAEDLRKRGSVQG
ncbi:TM2 domain-containing protein [Actinopolyspora saharensis]|uniref:TM2 domain-containing membrane protein YozV n=1 Tax=Actinopolyspora saharensis TaxID=995062 RepID=A0A1H1ELA4_9ACTN|nr:TM2 domain-containing protein [Actinopolyspora saharensis]SDQ89259.1 TM2 domain-containing membrane protein YozV [Actinopolyspora saharensis]